MAVIARGRYSWQLLYNGEATIIIVYVAYGPK